jgi:hypothetical protein
LEVEKLKNWVLKEEVLKHELLLRVYIVNISFLSHLIQVKQIVILLAATVILVSSDFLVTLSSSQSSSSVVTFILWIGFRDDWHNRIRLLLDI